MPKVAPVLHLHFHGVGIFFFNSPKAVKMFLIDCAAQAISNKELQVVLKIAMQTVYTKQYAEAARSF